MAKGKLKRNNTIDDTEKLILQTINFKYQNWRHHISSDIAKMLIANALNTTVVEKSFEIYGYLLLDTKMVLILKKDYDQNKEDLYFFCSYFMDSLSKYLKLRQGDLHVTQTFGKNPFEKKTLNDQKLQLLLTGRTFNKAYHDPELLRLKTLIRRSKYTSAIDYSGMIGPVLVTLK